MQAFRISDLIANLQSALKDGYEYIDSIDSLDESIMISYVEDEYSNVDDFVDSIELPDGYCRTKS